MVRILITNDDGWDAPGLAALKSLAGRLGEVFVLAPRDPHSYAGHRVTTDSELTLAETGKLLGEHEASCSRHLARTRKTLRNEIARRLRDHHGLSEAEIADCFAAVSQDPGELDLRQLLRMEPVRKESRDDRSTVRGRT